MKNAVNYRYSSRQKAVATAVNVGSAVGHTAGIFGGAAVGVNVAKAMSDNEINLGLSIATGVVSALAVAAATSVATEYAASAIRKKADITSPLSMLTNPCGIVNPYGLGLEGYGSLLETVSEADDSSPIEDTAESDDSSPVEDDENEVFDPLADDVEEFLKGELQ